MFTGIVEETGEVASFERNECGGTLAVTGRIATVDVVVGDSLSVGGCCLTVVSQEGSTVRFDLLEETIQSTAFAQLKSGARVNLERSIAVGGRLGGHFLSGHVDEAAKVLLFEKRGENYYLFVEAASKSARYLAPKGSVAIDGVSLTVCEVNGSSFSVWLIPHTLEVTTLGDLEPGNLVNLEFDLLAKYVESILAHDAAK